MRPRYLALALALIACESPETPQYTVVLVGDSTVASQLESNEIQGWGYFFTQGSGDSINNSAVPGMSTRTFYQQYWSRVLSYKPEIILIQFGLNDVNRLPERHTTIDEFKNYLRLYHREALAIGAVIVFVTSPNVTSHNSCVLKSLVKPYVDAMKEVATELDAPIIDLYSFSTTTIESLCPDFSSIYARDGGHMNQAGAKLYSEFVESEFNQIRGEL